MSSNDSCQLYNTFLFKFKSWINNIPITHQHLLKTRIIQASRILPELNPSFPDKPRQNIYTLIIQFIIKAIANIKIQSQVNQVKEVKIDYKKMTELVPQKKDLHVLGGCTIEYQFAGIEMHQSRPVIKKDKCVDTEFLQDQENLQLELLINSDIQLAHSYTNREPSEELIKEINESFSNYQKLLSQTLRAHSESSLNYQTITADQLINAHIVKIKNSTLSLKERVDSFLKTNKQITEQNLEKLKCKQAEVQKMEKSIRTKLNRRKVNNESDAVSNKMKAQFNKIIDLDYTIRKNQATIKDLEQKVHTLTLEKESANRMKAVEVAHSQAKRIILDDEIKRLTDSLNRVMPYINHTEELITQSTLRLIREMRISNRLRGLMGQVKNTFKKMSYNNIINAFEEQLGSNTVLSDNLKNTFMTIVYKVFSNHLKEIRSQNSSGRVDLNQIRVNFKQRFKDKKDSTEQTHLLDTGDIDHLLMKGNVILSAERMNEDFEYQHELQTEFRKRINENIISLHKESEISARLKKKCSIFKNVVHKEYSIEYNRNQASVVEPQSSNTSNIQIWPTSDYYLAPPSKRQQQERGQARGKSSHINLVRKESGMNKKQLSDPFLKKEKILNRTIIKKPQKKPKTPSPNNSQIIPSTHTLQSDQSSSLTNKSELQNSQIKRIDSGIGIYSYGIKSMCNLKTNKQRRFQQENQNKRIYEIQLTTEPKDQINTCPINTMKQFMRQTEDDKIDLIQQIEELDEPNESPRYCHSDIARQQLKSVSMGQQAVQTNIQMNQLNQFLKQVNTSCYQQLKRNILFQNPSRPSFAKNKTMSLVRRVFHPNPADMFGIVGKGQETTPNFRRKSNQPNGLQMLQKTFQERFHSQYSKQFDLKGSRSTMLDKWIKQVQTYLEKQPQSELARLILLKKSSKEQIGKMLLEWREKVRQHMSCKAIKGWPVCQHLLPLYKKSKGLIKTSIPMKTQVFDRIR